MVDNLLAAAKEKTCSNIALAGGVACNTALRNELENRKEGHNIFYPSPIFCTDNAAMIGCAAYYESLAGNFADLSLNAIPYLGINLK